MPFNSRKIKKSNFTTGTLTAADTFDFIQNGVNKKGTIQQVVDLVADVYGASLRTYEFESQMVADDIALGEYAIVEENEYSFYKITDVAASGNDVTLTSGLVATYEHMGNLQVGEPSDLLLLNPAAYSVGNAMYVTGWDGSVQNGKFGWWKVESGTASDNEGTIKDDTAGAAIWSAAGKHWGRAYGEYIRPEWFGAFMDGTTNDYTAFNSSLGQSTRILLGQGVYKLSQELITSSAEADAMIIEGQGTSQTVLMFAGTNGVTLAGTNVVLRDLTIIDGNAYSAPPTTLALFHASLPLEGNITSGTVGLTCSRNNIRVDNVQVMGFATGNYRTNSKFYMSNYNVRCHYNLLGHHADTNFVRSFGCYYTNNFEENEKVDNGQHYAVDTSFEIAGDYENESANFPKGGVYIGPAGEGVYEHCWMETVNFYNFSKKTRITKPANLSPATLFAPHYISDSKHGHISRNFVLPPWLSNWSTSEVSYTNAITQIDDDKRYSIITSAGAAAQHRALTPMNYEARGWNPPDTDSDGRSSAQYWIMAGVWIHIKSSNFTTGTGNDDTYPQLFVNVEPTTGSNWNFNVPVRTLVYGQDAFNNSAIGGTGSATTTTANKLVDSGASFQTTTSMGALVENTTAGTNTIVTAIDSDTTLSLRDDIFTSGQAYDITCWQYLGFVTFSRATFSPANPVAGIRMEIRLGDAGEDHSSSNRILWAADPSIQIFADNTHPSVAMPDRLKQFNVSDISNPPTDAELDALFGTPAQVGPGYSCLLDDAAGNANVYYVRSNGTSWWISTLTKAV